MKKVKFLVFLFLISFHSYAQSVYDNQMLNARATGYAIVAARNPGKSFSILMIPWDGINTLEYNANNQINDGWHPQAVVKGNYFYQSFDGTDFSKYSSVVLSQSEFDQYKSVGTQWWIVCSLLPAFSYSISTSDAGNVGIGTTSPSEKLSVNGNIRSKKLIVTQTGWSDYVFDLSYRLAPLFEVEKFIKSNKHLPDVPSAKQVDKEGIDVGENQAVLLRKIEELTLYIIEQGKQIKDQQGNFSALQLKLETQINQLKISIKKVRRHG